jgi:hypothetical protein
MGPFHGCRLLCVCHNGCLFTPERPAAPLSSELLHSPILLQNIPHSLPQPSLKSRPLMQHGSPVVYILVPSCALVTVGVIMNSGVFDLHPSSAPDWKPTQVTVPVLLTLDSYSLTLYWHTIGTHYICHLNTQTISCPDRLP